MKLPLLLSLLAFTFHPKLGMAFDEKDVKSGKKETRPEVPASTQPKLPEPSSLDETPSDDVLDPNSTIGKQIAPNKTAPGIAGANLGFNLGLGLAQGGFDASSAGVLHRNRFVDFELGFSYYLLTRKSKSFSSYGPTSGIRVHVNFLKIFDPYLRIGVGYGHWTMKSSTAEQNHNGGVSHVSLSAGLAILMTKHFALIASREALIYGGKSPWDFRNNHAKTNPEQRTGIYFLFPF